MTMALGLGVDPSTTSTGLALVEYQLRQDRLPVPTTAHAVVWSYTVKPAGKAWEDRLAPLFDGLVDALEEVKRQVDQWGKDNPVYLPTTVLDRVVLELPEMLGKHSRSNSAVMAAYGVAVAAVRYRLDGWAPFHYLRAQGAT